MKVFISSVIGGMEEHRAAAREAVESLGHTVIAAEDFGASPRSPQQVCLGGVRDADVVILLLGARYGTAQASGLSPTHEEYRAARGTTPVFVFVQADVTPEPEQKTFIDEVRGWEDAGYRQSFDTSALAWSDMSLSGLESAESPPIVLPRAALLFDSQKYAEDITVRLRRQARR